MAVVISVEVTGSLFISKIKQLDEVNSVLLIKILFHDFLISEIYFCFKLIVFVKYLFSFYIGSCLSYISMEMSVGYKCIFCKWTKVIFIKVSTPVYICTFVTNCTMYLLDKLLRKCRFEKTEIGKRGFHGSRLWK